MSDKKDDTQLVAELETLKSEVFPNVDDGSLLVITVGNVTVPATRSDMERVSETVDEMFEDVKGVKVLLVPHTVEIEKIPLPTLRNIQSQVVNSWNEESTAIVNDIDGFNIFGGE